MKNKSLYLLLGVLVLVVVVLVAVSKNRTAKAPAESPQAQSQQKPSSEQPKAVPVQAVDVGKLPQEFPSDIPLEAGAQVTLNYNATNAAGNFQASREFISKKTVAENYALYQKVLKDNGWTITGTQENTPAGNLIFATKGENNLNIRIYTDPDKKIRVSISNEIKK
jgi:hypothetical protein